MRQIGCSASSFYRVTKRGKIAGAGVKGKGEKGFIGLHLAALEEVGHLSGQSRNNLLFIPLRSFRINRDKNIADFAWNNAGFQKLRGTRESFKGDLYGKCFSWILKGRFIAYRRR